MRDICWNVKKTRQKRIFLRGTDIAIDHVKDGIAHMTSLHALVFDTVADRGLLEAVANCGLAVSPSFSDLGSLRHNLRIFTPDLVIMRVLCADAEMAERFARDLSEHSCAAIVFAQYASAGVAAACIKAGVTTFVVDGFAPTRLAAIIAVAMARFEQGRELKLKMRRLVAGVQERKAIERAKAILMRRRDLAEPLAYQALRKMALDRGKRVYDIAQTIVKAEELLAQK